MNWSKHILLSGGLGVALTAAILLGWWYGWPVYQLRAAQRAYAAGNFLKADELLQRLLLVVRDRTDAYYLHARVLRRLKRTYDALAALDHARELGLPDSGETRRERTLLLAQDYFDQAEPELERALGENPADEEVLDALESGYARSGRWPQLEAVCTRRLQLRPDRVESHFQRAQARIQNERLAEAEADFREVLRRAPEHYHARLYLAHCLLASARIAEARPELLKCRQLRPDSPDPLVGLAVCAEEQNDLEGAQSYLSKARALDPASPLVLKELGNLLMFRQRYDLALDVLATLVSINPRDKGAHLRLAQALRHTGDSEQAKEHERRYQELEKEEREKAVTPHRGR